MKKKSNLFWGYFLLSLGFLMLLANWFPIGMDMIWPIFPLLVGGGFIYGYLINRKNFGLLMPGVILTIVGILFFYCNISGWHHMETLWPIFLLAPSLGFAAMYIMGTQDKGLLIPAVILCVLSLIFLFVSSGLGQWWPVLMITCWCILIWQQKNESKEKIEDIE